LRRAAGRARAPCGRCGGYWLQPNGGTELRIVDMLVDDA
jgi:hydrogenase nickel incorporation protein HypA/HybF